VMSRRVQVIFATAAPREYRTPTGIYPCRSAVGLI
jgi:hypothetical protein